MKVIVGTMTPADLAKAMKELGLNITQISERIGVSQPTTSRYLRGDLKIPLTIERLVQYMLREHRGKNIEISRKDLYVLGNDDLVNLIEEIRKFIQARRA
jgi:predicted transcriptional regulator